MSVDEDIAEMYLLSYVMVIESLKENPVIR